MRAWWQGRAGSAPPDPPCLSLPNPYSRTAGLFTDGRTIARTAAGTRVAGPRTAKRFKRVSRDGRTATDGQEGFTMPQVSLTEAEHNAVTECVRFRLSAVQRMYAMLARSNPQRVKLEAEELHLLDARDKLAKSRHKQYVGKTARVRVDGRAGRNVGTIHS